MTHTTSGPPVQYLSISFHLHSYWIPLYLMDFTWDNNVTFDFSDACLFRHPVYFNGQDFLSVTSDFSWQWFNVVKLREMLSPKRVTRHYFGTAWPLMIFLVSFVPRLSPKQSRCFTNFHLQIIGDITVWRLQPGPPKNFQPIKNHSFNKELGVRTPSGTVLFFDWLVSILNVFAIYSGVSYTLTCLSCVAAFL